jgi:hypothetical protein
MSHGKGKGWGVVPVSVPVRYAEQGFTGDDFENGTGGKTRTCISRFWRPGFYRLNYTCMVASRGFEPRLPESNSGVLPLDELAMAQRDGIEPPTRSASNCRSTH